MATVVQAVRRALKGYADGYEVELRLRHRDGHYVPMLARGYIQRDAAGRARRFSGVNSDLTERKRAEADRTLLVQERAAQQLRQFELAATDQALRLAEQHAQDLRSLLAERDRLLALLSHEIHQPLNNASAAIQGAQLALRDAQVAPGAAAALLERGAAVLGHVVATVNNTLAASTLLNSAASIPIQEAEVDTLIALALADVAASEGTRVHVARTTGGRTAEVNVALLRLALRNLLANALAYSPDGALVTVSAALTDEPLALVIEVRDLGEGIAPELLPTIFERGTRGPQAASVQGTGLGLYVVSRIVELHHGRIDVRPNEPRGSIFRIVLPQGRLD